MHPVTVSIASGGLMFRALRRVGVASGDGVRPGRGILLVFLLGWLPLAVLTLLEGTFSGTAVEVPFLRDPSVHARLLVAVPLLFVAEATVSRAAQRLFEIVRERGLVAEDMRPALDARVEQLARERDSRVVELAIVLLTAAVVWFSRDAFVASRVLPHTTWLGAPGGAAALSRAGWWYAIVSLFVANILGLRWVWWIVVWTRFVTGFLRRHLIVSAGHPDLHGGLAFLTMVQGSLAPVFAGLAATVSGRLGYEMMHDGAALASVQVPFAVVMVLAALVMFLPLLLFGGRLGAAKRRALAQYDGLGQQLVTRFEQKWLGGTPPEEPFLASSDPSTYTDFATVYDALRRMQPTALEVKRAVGALVLVALPFLPLLLTAMSLKDIVTRMVKLLV
jgi:hypothetical protein